MHRTLTLVKDRHDPITANRTPRDTDIVITASNDYLGLCSLVDFMYVPRSPARRRSPMTLQIYADRQGNELWITGESIEILGNGELRGITTNNARYRMAGSHRPQPWMSESHYLRDDDLMLAPDGRVYFRFWSRNTNDYQVPLLMHRKGDLLTLHMASPDEVPDVTSHVKDSPFLFYSLDCDPDHEGITDWITYSNRACLGPDSPFSFGTMLRRIIDRDGAAHFRKTLRMNHMDFILEGQEVARRIWQGDLRSDNDPLHRAKLMSLAQAYIDCEVTILERILRNGHLLVSYEDYIAERTSKVLS